MTSAAWSTMASRRRRSVSMEMTLLWPYHAGEADETCRARVFWTGRMGPDSEGWSPADPVRPPDGLESKVKIRNAKPQNQTWNQLSRLFSPVTKYWLKENEQVVRFPAKSVCERLTLTCFRCRTESPAQAARAAQHNPQFRLSTKATENKLLQILKLEMVM